MSDYLKTADVWTVLDLIVAEFTSDPMSVQCFDLRIVERATALVREHREAEVLDFPEWHLKQEVLAAHRGLDRLGAPKTKRVRRRDGIGEQEITLGVAERFQTSEAAFDRRVQTAFEEGFALSKLGGPIEVAWKNSDARNS